MPDIKGKDPVFVFAHILVPHTPYVFDRDGNYLPEDKIAGKNEKVNYIEQLIFTNKKVKELVNMILSKSKTPPIIILQGDEGPFPERYRQDEINFNKFFSVTSKVK